MSIDLPDLLEHLDDFAAINGFVAFGLFIRVFLNLIFYHTDSIFPMVSSDSCKLIQYSLLFNFVRFQVTWP